MNGATEAITGTLGGGKTAFAVERMLEHLLAGGYCYTNVEIYLEKVREWMLEKGRVFEPDRLIFLTGDLGTFHKQVKRGTHECQVMVVLDEASLDFNARDWASTSKDLLAFNNFVRKLDIILLYITQRFEDLDKQFRARVGVLWVCRNMKHLKLLGLIPFPLPLFFRVRFDNTRGNGKPVKLDSEAVVKSWAWGLYNSDALTGKGHEQFLAMETANRTPLKRIQKPKTQGPSIWPELITVCLSAFSLSF